MPVTHKNYENTKNIEESQTGWGENTKDIEESQTGWGRRKLSQAANSHESN